MSDHDFEKKVQQKMDELKLRPSEAVWKGVEVNLLREKRRRRTLLWLPVMGILLFTGGYFMFSGRDLSANRDQSAGSSVAQRQTAPAAPAAEQEQSTTGATTGKLNTAQGSVTRKSNHRQEIAGSNDRRENQVDDKLVSRKPEIGNVNEQVKMGRSESGDDKNSENKSGRKEGNKSDNKSDSKENEPDSKSNNRSENNSDSKTDIQSSNPLRPVRQDNSTVIPKPQDNKNAVAPDSIRVSIPPSANEIDAKKNHTTITGQSTADSAARSKVSPDSSKKKLPAPPKVKDIAKNKKHPVASKWQWGVMAGAGVTNISEGSVFNLLNRVRVDDLASAPLAYSGIPPMPDPEPSPIRTGPVFSAGAFVKRNISDRVSISLGLQYSYASVYTKVGSRVDSLATVNFGNNSSRITGQYYRADNDLRDYTNRYHFIDLPLELGVRVNRNKRMPISINGGITLSRLVYTNALHFDGFTKVYYENNDFYNKLQAGFNASVTFGFFQDKKHPVTIGPSFRYNLSNLVREEVTTTEGQHIWSAGLNIKMLLKK